MKTPPADPVDAEAQIDAILAKAERYTLAAQAEYGNLRMYAVLYAYMQAKTTDALALLKDYAQLSADAPIALIQDYLDGKMMGNVMLSSGWIERRDELLKRAEALVADE